MQRRISAIGLTMPLVFAASALAAQEPQPLTRADCEQAGLAWDENANVCGEAAKAVKSKEQKKQKKRKGKKRKKDQSRLKEEPPSANSH
jgi:hypothetical protein